MRKIPAFLLLLCTVNAFAGSVHKEFDESQEIKCYQELKSKGCVQGDEEDLDCAQAKKKELSASCRQIQEAKKLSM